MSMPWIARDKVGLYLYQDEPEWSGSYWKADECIQLPGVLFCDVPVGCHRQCKLTDFIGEAGMVAIAQEWLKKPGSIEKLAERIKDKPEEWL